MGSEMCIRDSSYVDPVTAALIWEMTGEQGSADNLYYHFSNFTADNRFLILASDRTGSWQLYRVEIQSGHIVQLTDESGVNARSACPDHTEAHRLYYMRGPEIIAMDILEFTTRKVGEIPKPYVGGFQQPTQSGDGKWLTLGKRSDSQNWEIGLMLSLIHI